MTNQSQLAVKMVLDLWNSRIKATDELLNKLTDEQLMHEAAPGRNRGIYLLGHLAAVHDHMLAILDFEKQVHPEFHEIFITKPDRAVAELPSVSEVREYWKTVNDKLAAHYTKLSADEWFQKHTLVSDEDFAKEPHRNRLTIVAGRTAHLAGHLGQLIYLK
ncbi:MAG TPA: DinB family protein [Bacteroidia bacterium]|nr:DinB family protein [Bacteroidia bacterium]